MSPQLPPRRNPSRPTWRRWLIAISLAGCTIGVGPALSGCGSQLERLRADWAGMKQRSNAPCADVRACRALIERLDRAKREACGDAPRCEATADLEREIRGAVLEKFRAPCRDGEAEACVHAHAFGYGDGLRSACDLGLVEGCLAACAEGSDGEAEERCEDIARDLNKLLDRCAYKRHDRGQACRELGVLVRTMSAPDPDQPPNIGGSPVLYATPLLEDRSRARYALDYFSRACHLGDAAGCAALCERPGHKDSDARTLPVCSNIAADHTAKSLRTACRKRDGKACHQLALLSANMGFYDRDPAGFFISGPGRVIGLEAMACHLGVEQACGGEQPF
ncbi:MAG: hypothetical protein ACOC1F_01370 [Myxococcota bacterium]